MRPSVGTRLFYGFGSVAYGVVDNGFSYIILFFYSTVVGLPPGLTGLALMVALIFDAISDPIVGHVSDNWRSKWGRRHPFMYAAIIPIAIGYFLLWNPPAALWNPETPENVWALFGYLVLLAVIVRTFLTFYEVPSSALGAEFTQDYDQRTVLFSYRYLFGWWGGLTIGLLAYGVFLQPTEAHPTGLTNPAGYLPFSIASVILIAGAIFTSALGTHKEIPNLPKPPPPQGFTFGGTFRDVFAALSNRSFIALFLAAVLSALAAGVGTTLFLYMSTHFWGLTTQHITYIQLGNFFSAALALGIAPRLARGRNKKGLAIILSLVSIFYLPLLVNLKLLGLYFEPTSAWYFPVMWLHNISEVTILIIIAILVSSMVADVVEDSEIQTGRRSEGLFFAARTFAAKVTNGLGVALGGLILTIAQVPREISPDAATASSSTNLALLYVPALMVTYLVSVALLSRYKIDREGHSKNLEALAARAHAASDPTEPL